MSHSPLAVSSPLAAGTPLPNPILPIAIALPVVSASASEAVQPLEDRSFMTGLARRICAWEDAGGAWKVASYALHAILYAVGYLTIVGNLAFIWLSREVGRVDSENALLRDGRLANPGEIQRLQAQIQQHANQPAANAAALAQAQLALQEERTNLGQINGRLEAAQQQVTDLQGQVGEWETACKGLIKKAEDADLFAAIHKDGSEAAFRANIQSPKHGPGNVVATPVTKLTLRVTQSIVANARKELIAKINALTPERRAELIELFQNAGKSEVSKDIKENKDNKSKETT